MTMIITSSLDGTLKICDIHKLEQIGSNPRSVFNDMGDDKKVSIVFHIHITINYYVHVVLVEN